MPFADELLAVALLAVYLLDGVQWLERGECAVEWRGGRPTRFGFGPRWTLAGRRPWLPLPFTASVAWRTRWRLPGESAGAEGSAFASRAAAVRPVARLAALNAALVALVAPALLIGGAQRGFVVAVAASVLLTLVAIAVAFARRAALGCTGAQLAGTAAIAIVCLPCAGNLARALVGRAHGALTLPEWPATNLTGAMRTTALAAVRDELEAERSYADEGSRQRNALDSALARLPQENA